MQPLEWPSVTSEIMCWGTINTKQRARAIIFISTRGFHVEWSFAFTTTELEQLYFPFFVGDFDRQIQPQSNGPSTLQHILSAFPPTIIGTKQTEENELKQERLATLLTHWIKNKFSHSFHSLFPQCSLHSDQELQMKLQSHHEAIFCLLSLPTKMSNIFLHEIPDIFLPQSFTQNILAQSHQYIQEYISHSDFSKYHCAAIFYILGKYISLYPRESKLTILEIYIM